MDGRMVVLIMKKRNKRLSLLVACALSAGFVFSAAPQQVDAATSIGYFEYKTGADLETVASGYTVTGHDGKKGNYKTEAEALNAVIEALAEDTGSSAISFALWKDINGDVATNKISSFLTALAARDVTLANGGSIAIVDASGNAVVLNGSSDSASKFTLGTDGTVEVKSNMAAVATTGTDTTVKVDADTTVGSIVATTDGAKVTVDGTGSVTTVAGNGDLTIEQTDGTTITAVTSVGTLTADSELTVGTIAAGGDIEAGSNAITATDAIKSSGSITAGAVSANSVSATGDISAKTINSTGAVSGANITTTGAITAESISTTGELNTTGTVTSTSITAGTVTLGSGATIADAENTTITTSVLKVNSADQLTSLNLVATDGSSIRVVNSDGTAASAEIVNAVKTALGDKADSVSIDATTDAQIEAVDTAIDTVKGKMDTTEAAIAKVNSFAAADANTIAQTNPFTATTKLPTASDLASIANVSSSALDEIKAANTAIDYTDLETAIAATDGATKAAYEKQLAALKAEQAAMPTTAAGFAAKAEALRAAVQEAGKTAGAPGATGVRTAGVITNTLMNNVAARTGELRDLAMVGSHATDDGTEEADNDIWFRYKHAKVDVDNGGVYSESTVKTNTYQLGYDRRLGERDYLGLYVGTTNGSADFKSAITSGSVDIDDSLDVGIYGTHMMSGGQYIDYVVRTGKFDSKYSGQSWTTKDTGVTLGYGAKLKASERLTYNPYLQLSYDKISVDSYLAGLNTVSSDDSNNWSAKIGINLLDDSGLYGGVAYSRGLSGSYTSYINGIAMPTMDNDANIVYLTLGYRANVGANVFLDLSAEKTFVDYDGWNASGKVNFFF